MSELDVLCLGRAGVDLYAEQVGVPLEQVTSFAKYVGGCPANISVGTSRLGLKSGMLTRVSDDGLGRFVRTFLEQERVDVSGIKLDPKHPNGLVVLGIEPPDRFPLLFFRENCADIHLSLDDVTEAHLRRTRAIVVTGTGFSREPSRSATWRAVELARSLGKKIILDIDWRPTLWENGRAEALKELGRVVSVADLVVGTEEEVAVAAGSEGTGAAEHLRARMTGLLVMKLGPRGAVAHPANGKPIHVPGFRIDILNTLGAGDGFMSGFLRGWLTGQSIAESLRLGNAVGAIVVTRHGCAPAMPGYEETLDFMKRTPTT